MTDVVQAGLSFGVGRPSGWPRPLVRALAFPERV